MPSLADLELTYLKAQGAAGPSLQDAREQKYTPNEWAYFSALSGLAPAAAYSLADHQLAYYRAQTSLVGKSLADTAAQFWAGGGSLPSIPTTYQGDFIDATDLASYSFLGVPIGTAAANRRVVVAAVARNGTDTSNPIITIGGIAATLDATIATGTLDQSVAIASAVVPTGTTAVVTVQYAAGTGRCGIMVWTLSGTKVTSATSTADPGALTLGAAVAGNKLIAAEGHRFDSGANSSAWSGVTEVVDKNVEGVFYMSGAHGTAVGADAVSVAYAATPAAQTAAAVAYG